MLSLLLFTASHLLSEIHFNFMGRGAEPPVCPPAYGTGGGAPRYPPSLRHFRCLGASPQPTAHPPRTWSPRGSSRGFDGVEGSSSKVCQWETASGLLGPHDTLFAVSIFTATYPPFCPFSGVFYAGSSTGGSAPRYPPQGALPPVIPHRGLRPPLSPRPTAQGALPPVIPPAYGIPD